MKQFLIYNFAERDTGIVKNGYHTILPKSENGF